MEFKTHQAAGVLIAGCILLKTNQVFGIEWLYITTASIIGSVLPDIDHSNSGAARAVPVAGYITGSVLRHRGPVTHSIWTVVVVGMLMKLSGLFSPLVGLAAVGGILSHHFLDMLTEQRLKWLWPIKTNLLPLPPIISVTTGSIIETMLIRPILWFACGYIWFLLLT